MSFQRGDRVTVYGYDLIQRGRNATVLAYKGRDRKRRETYLIEFKGGSRSIVREEWLELHAPPMMPEIDAREYLDALNALSDR